jgi:drug/metabolite transporter (DMT)-like permease
MATGVALGLLAAVLWGVADFCIRGATQSGGTFRTLYFDQLVALLFLGLAIAPWYPLTLTRVAPAWIVAAVGLNLAILVGAALLYRAFAIGALSVISPIAASFGAIVTALALLSGERPHQVQLAGIAVTLVGVALAGTHMDGKSAHKSRQGRSRLRLAPGVTEALIATAIFGVTYWALRFVTPVVGGAQVALIGKIVDLIALTMFAGAAWIWRRAPWAPALMRQDVEMVSAPLAPRGWRFWVWIIPAGALDVSANVAYNVGVATALTSVVVTVSSLFSAITVLLAWVFLRERLSRWQWMGVALILAGIALVNA